MFFDRGTAKVVAAPTNKRDRVVELYYIACCARNGKEVNFEVSKMHAYWSLGFIIRATYYPCPNERIAVSCVSKFRPVLKLWLCHICDF